MAMETSTQRDQRVKSYNKKSWIVEAEEHKRDQTLYLSPIECSCLQDIFVTHIFTLPTHIDIDQFKNALGTVLSNYPMLAGRMVSDGMGRLGIDCKNQGVLLTVESKQHDPLWTVKTLTEDNKLKLRGQLVRKPAILVHQLINKYRQKNEEHLNVVQRLKYWLYNLFTTRNPLVSIKVTYLSDSATAVGFYFSHAIGDGSSFYCFIRDLFDVLDAQIRGDDAALNTVMKQKVAPARDLLDKFLKANLVQDVTDQTADYRKLNLHPKLRFLRKVLMARTKCMFFDITPQQLARFKQEVDSDAGRDLSIKLTTMDILQARLWKEMQALERKHGHSVKLLPQINMRPRIHQYGDQDVQYIGDAIISRAIDFPIADPDTASVAVVAHEIRKQMGSSELMEHFIQDMNFFQKWHQKGLSEFIYPQFSLERNSGEILDMVQTSWMGFDYEYPGFERVRLGGKFDRGIKVGNVHVNWFYGSMGPKEIARTTIYRRIYRDGFEGQSGVQVSYCLPNTSYKQEEIKALRRAFIGDIVSYE
ncbi:hypothetical protein MIR68_010217 [Amoeboaphelidium protococcarum]|nr:hypothetical protein MIR68_010217 [Amoeboaphelidium protococcarum]